VLDSCVEEGLSCYCERFDLAALQAAERADTWWKGVQQPVNTYSNLYAIVSAGYVACRLWQDRSAGSNANVIKSDWWMGDVWVFCVLFLGLGSMWFHGSISKWVSWFDGFSMYVFTGFLVFYTLDRGFIRHNVNPDTRTRVFWIGYLLSVLLFTMIGAMGVMSEILIGIMIGAYVAIEFFYASPVFWPAWSEFRRTPFLLWLGALIAFGQAALFRGLATTPTDPWCAPDSFWQPHAFWHIYAGVMALCLYFYWREDTGGVGRLPEGVAGSGGTSGSSSGGSSSGGTVWS
jgi:uncharacterized membrane protein YgcG